MTDKRVATDLAILGGTTACAETLHTHRPGDFDRERLLTRINEALDRRWLSNGGPLVQEFEARVAEMAGVNHAVATSSATMALECIVRALDLTQEVIMPSLTFAATPNAVRWAGLQPVFCDVDPVTGCLDPQRVAEVMTPRTSAILGVHLWGRTCAVDELASLAEERGVRLFYDAAHAIGCAVDGVPVGGFGTAEVFSFHATKIVSSFEGGAVVTDDAELAARVRALHQFGKGGTQGGINGKMSEPSAAMGLTSLEAFPVAVWHNTQIQHLYREELAGLTGLTFFSPPPSEATNAQYVIVEIDESECGLGRNTLLDILEAENIRALPPIGVPTCHQIEPFAGDRARESHPVALPYTERIAARTISLPAGSSIQFDEVRTVCSVIRCAVGRGLEVRRALDLHATSKLATTSA
ncbi:aminotransferase class I/II-fold pyridoxal phosphate-dependent enzyme [Aeromicrobium sp. CF3.5]|uniref:aminotransferase class I/II-fold pyridoxal phosphate-dependent enzyme n=1 Tax=Aeromicrobium sp. CF3.5 TaxID=3373078 RepID=UPI003EE7C339